jgi:hypothetical protein
MCYPEHFLRSQIKCFCPGLFLSRTISVPGKVKAYVHHHPYPVAPGRMKFHFVQNKYEYLFIGAAEASGVISVRITCI